MNVLDLFSGIGGFSLGFERAGMHTIAFCEIDTYCRAVLRQRWPDIPIHDDVRKLDGAAYRGTVDLVCGGYPCQPFSMAGRRAGAEDERHLWPEMLRVVRGCRPRWVVAENVAGHITLGFDEVAASLEAEGFTVWPFVLPACAVDAPHRRDRLWILAHARCSWLHERGRSDDAEGEMPQPGGMGGDGLSRGCGPEAKVVADATRERMERHGAAGKQEPCAHASEELSMRQCAGSGTAHWAAESGVARVAYGVSRRVDRIKALGNAIVPQIAEIVGRAIMQFERSGE